MAVEARHRPPHRARHRHQPQHHQPQRLTGHPPFDRSVNPYRGCEHGCIYCYARPSHAWLGLSPGFDFERRLFHKPDAAAQLRRALAKPGYRPATLVLGANTAPYQPIERRLGSTRAILEVLLEARHPVAITTKSALVRRDLALLRELAAADLVAVQISVTMTTSPCFEVVANLCAAA